MNSDPKITGGPAAVPRRALGATEIVSHLARTAGWMLSGDGDDVAIERTFCFGDYFQTIAFVNAVAFIAHQHDHHPDLAVHHGRCVVRFRTHAVRGLSALDFACASHIDALVA